MESKTASTCNPETQDEPSAGSDPGRVGRNIATLGAGQLFTWTMTMGWTLVVPRVIGPGGLGLIFTAISVTGFLQIALGAGTGEYVTRTLVISPGDGTKLLATAAIARLMLAPLFSVAVVVWTQVARYSPQGNMVIYLSAGATILYLLAEPIQSYFQSIERMRYLALSDAIYKASQGIVGIGLTLLGLGAIGYAGCWMAMSGVVLLLNLRWLSRFLRIDIRTTKSDLLAVARGSAAYWTAGIFNLFYLWIDTAMLSVMTNPTVVGWYGVPTKLFQTMLFVPTVFATAWLPRFVTAFQRSRHDLHRLAEGPIALVVSLAVPLAAVIAVMAGPMITLVYGSAYARATPVLIVLGFGLIPMYLNIMLGNACVAAGLQRRWTWLMAGATVLNPVVNAILIPLMQQRYGNGAIGAAIALDVTELAIAAGGIVVSHRLAIGRRIVTRAARTALASAGMGIVVFFLRTTGPALSFVAGGAALIVLAVVVEAVTPDEQRQVLVLGRRGVRRVSASLAGHRTARRDHEGITSLSDGGDLPGATAGIGIDSVAAESFE